MTPSKLQSSQLDCYFISVMPIFVVAVCCKICYDLPVYCLELHMPTQCQLQYLLAGSQWSGH